MSRRAWKRTWPRHGADARPRAPAASSAPAAPGSSSASSLTSRIHSPAAASSPATTPPAKPRLRPCAGPAHRAASIPSCRCRRRSARRRAARARPAARAGRRRAAGRRAGSRRSRRRRHGAVRRRHALQRVGERQPARVAPRTTRPSTRAAPGPPRARARSPRPGPPATADGATKPLTPSSTSSVAALSGSATTTLGVPGRARLDDDEPVALARARAAPGTARARSAASTRAWSTKPGRRDRVAQPERVDRSASTRPRSGPSPKISARSSGAGPARAPARHQRGHALLRDVAAGEHRPAGSSRHKARPRPQRRPRTRPAAPSPRRAAPSRAQPRRVQAREAERALAGRARTAAARPADGRRPGRGTRASSARVHSSCQSTTSRKRPSGRSERRREQREVRERGGVDDVVAPARSAAGARSTPSRTPAAARSAAGPRRCRAPAAGPTATTRTPGTPGSAPRGHWRSVRYVTSCPSAREPLGEVAVPALGARRRCAGTGSRRRGRSARRLNHSRRRTDTQPCRSHEHRRAPSLPGPRSPLPDRSDELARLRRHPVPQRGGEHRALRRRGARRRWPSTASRGEVVVADNASEDGSAELADGRRRARRPRAAPRLRQRLPGRLRAPPAAATS